MSQELQKGLSADPKYIPSKFFYDRVGGQIFQLIMRMPEYYLTNCEYEILSLQKREILEALNPNKEGFELIEFGAGDGFKTKVLLDYLGQEKIPFKYIPIDISEEAALELAYDIHKKLPHVSVEPKIKDYFSALQEIKQSSSKKKVILFLGSNIGNFVHQGAVYFLGQLASLLKKEDKLLIGFDLKKDPQTIRRAYNDSLGYTKAFNLNLLNRFNRELDAHFDPNFFDFYAAYDPISGGVNSYLISLKKQTVRINAFNQNFNFDLWEAIHTELSQKYDFEMIESLADQAGFVIEKKFLDCKGYFVDCLFGLNTHL